MAKEYPLVLLVEGREEQIILINDNGSFFWRMEDAIPHFWRGSGEFGYSQPLSFLAAATLVHQSVAYRGGGTEESNNQWTKIRFGE